MKLFFCISLIFSYRLTIVPTFSAFESLLLGQHETSNDEAEIEAPEDRVLSGADGDSLSQ